MCQIKGTVSVISSDPRCMLNVWFYPWNLNRIKNVKNVRFSIDSYKQEMHKTDKPEIKINQKKAKTLI